MSVQGTMVACLSCKRIVWAHDGDHGDVRGLLNIMQMPCRLCADKGNYDGWRVDRDAIREMGVPDAWAALHRIASDAGFEWAASGTNEWFDAESPFRVRSQ